MQYGGWMKPCAESIVFLIVCRIDIEGEVKIEKSRG
jgi:hypothetical protein